MLQRRHALAREHVHPQAELTSQPRRLSANPAVAPQPNSQSADLALKDRPAIPDRRILIADHLPNIAR